MITKSYLGVRENLFQWKVSTEKYKQTLFDFENTSGKKKVAKINENC